MINWAKEVIVATHPYHQGTGFITSNGHVIGFRLQETTSSARKGTKTSRLEIAFIPLNTTETPERPDKRTLVAIMEQLQMEKTFLLSAPPRIQSSFDGTNEIRYFEDVNGNLYKQIQESAYCLDEEGTWGKLLHADAYCNDPFSLQEVVTVTKVANVYSVKGKDAELDVHVSNDNELTFRAFIRDELGEVRIPLNVADWSVHGVLDKLYVKGSPNVALEHTSSGALISNNMNQTFNGSAVKQLEKQFIKHSGLTLTSSQKMAKDVRKAKLDSNPFANLKADYRQLMSKRQR